jgi:hypothetical protein
MFKEGDKVRKIDGSSFSNGSYTATVKSIGDIGENDNVVWMKETGTFVAVGDLTLADNTIKEVVPEIQESIVYLERRLLSLESEAAKVRNAIEILKAI